MGDITVHINKHKAQLVMIESARQEIYRELKAIKKERIKYPMKIKIRRNTMSKLQSMIQEKEKWGALVDGIKVLENVSSIQIHNFNWLMNVYALENLVDKYNEVCREAKANIDYWEKELKQEHKSL